MVEVLGAHLFEAPVPPSVRAGKALPADLEALVLRCLAKDKGARPASAEALLEELRSLEDAPRYDRAAAFDWWRQTELRAQASSSTQQSRDSAPPAPQAVSGLYSLRNATLLVPHRPARRAG